MAWHSLLAAAATALLLLPGCAAPPEPGTDPRVFTLGGFVFRFDDPLDRIEVAGRDASWKGGATTWDAVALAVRNPNFGFWVALNQDPANGLLLPSPYVGWGAGNLSRQPIQVGDYLSFCHRDGPASPAGIALQVTGRGGGQAGFSSIRGCSADPTPGIPPAAKLRVHYVDVGTAAGTVWELPGGDLVVYDCGPSASTSNQTVASYLRDTLKRPPGSDLWALLVPNGHAEHTSGCAELLTTYRVRHLYDLWLDTGDAPASYRQFMADARASGATIHALAGSPAPGSHAWFSQWDVLPLPQSTWYTGLWAQVIAPQGHADSGWDSLPASSLAVRLTLLGVTYCFQGDLGSPQEERLLLSPWDRQCDVYLAGQNGGDGASSAAWLDAQDGLAPRVAVVSVGPNDQGLPAASALCRMQQAGAAVYSTAKQGDIVAETDGDTIGVSAGWPDGTDYCAPGATFWDTP